MKGGKALLIVIAAICLGAGFWLRGILSSTVISSPTPATVQIPSAIQDEREWRSLTDQEVKTWAKALAPFHPAEIRVFWGQEVLALKLFRSLQEVGKELKCEIRAAGGYADTPEITIQTGTGDPSGPVLARLFKEYLKGVNFPVKLDPLEGGKGVLIFVPDSPPWPQRAWDQKHDSRANKTVVTALARLVQKGVVLERSYSKMIMPSQSDSDVWRTEVMEVLEKPELGDGYVARFDSAKGFEGVYPDGLSTDAARRYIWIEQRVEVLGQFIKELSSQ